MGPAGPQGAGSVPPHRPLETDRPIKVPSFVLLVVVALFYVLSCRFIVLYVYLQSNVHLNDLLHVKIILHKAPPPLNALINDYYYLQSALKRNADI